MTHLNANGRERRTLWGIVRINHLIVWIEAMPLEYGQDLDGVFLDAVHDAVVAEKYLPDSFVGSLGNKTSGKGHFRYVSRSLAEAFDPTPRRPRIVASDVLTDFDQISACPVRPQELH